MQRPASAAETGTPPSLKPRVPGRVRVRRAVGSPGWTLVATQDPIELCRLIYQTVTRQMDATIFFLGLYDPTSQTLEVVWQVENGKELSGGSFPLRKGAGLSSRVVFGGESVLIRHWSDEGPRVQVQYATGTPGLPESAVAVPLKAGDHTIGLIAVQSYKPDMYGPADLQLLEALAGEAAIVIAG